MTTVFLFLVSLSIVINPSSSQTTSTLENVTEITIFAMSNVADTPSGKAIIGGELLALESINNDPNLLPNYQLNLEIFDSQKSRLIAVNHALNLTMQYAQQNDGLNNDHRHIFPIMLGSDYSSISTTVSPILEAYSMGQLSPASTSAKLSQTYNYPYFYRTIPSDAVQAQGIILLCKEFGWTNIAVVYVDDDYGDWFNRKIQEFVRDDNTTDAIDVESIAIAEDVVSYSNCEEAAEQILGIIQMRAL